jgi:hypothetical protein
MHINVKYEIVPFMRDFCSSNEFFFVEYDTLDRIYKFEDKQMKTGMTLGHKCFVTQFSTKAEIIDN